MCLWAFQNSENVFSGFFKTSPSDLFAHMITIYLPMVCSNYIISPLNFNLHFKHLLHCIGVYNISRLILQQCCQNFGFVKSKSCLTPVNKRYIFSGLCLKIKQLTVSFSKSQRKAKKLGLI